jgi:diguanylate cyclase (GGDEF)-like protein
MMGGRFSGAARGAAAPVDAGRATVPVQAVDPRGPTSRERAPDAAITVTLDPPTLLLALLAGFLLLALELGFAHRALARQVELRVWAAGTWLLLGGFGAFAARPLLPTWLGVLVSNALILAGLSTYTRALYRFLCDRPLPRWAWGLFGAAVAGLVVMLPWPLYMRSSAISLVYVALLLPSVAVIARHGWHAEPSLRTVAATMSIACLALLVRAWHAWNHPQQYGSLLQSSLGQGLTFLVCFLAVLGAGFGFVLSSFQRVAQQMERLATHDGLTGCANRSTADTLLEHALQRGRREAAPVALVVLDIDHFKSINDRFGHRAGDAVLVAVADAVRTRLRKSDVFARIGGEEFTLLLPDTDAAGALRLADEVRRVVEQLRLAGTGLDGVRITVSAGIALAPAGAACTAEELFALADKRLYRAKAQGRNRVEAAAPAMTLEQALPV